MTGSVAEVRLGDLYEPISGMPKYIRDYVDAHPGLHPVYSASLTGVFGNVDDFDYEGPHLTWVMNGYGGRMQEVDGKFSANRDRGVLRPRELAADFDLTYVRFAAEAQMVAAAVGRRVDGRLNEYTKLYPDEASEVIFELPIQEDGSFDTARMAEIGDRLRRVERAQRRVRSTQTPLRRAEFPFECPEPRRTLVLSDADFFELSIGKRVLRKDQTEIGVPVYSANALVPFGNIETSNLVNFDRPSILWGIDGNFDWNLIPAEEVFATTDHCGRLQLLDELLDPTYVWCYLRWTRSRYGFDRVFRASLGNIAADVEVTVPLDVSGDISLDRQKELASLFLAREHAQGIALAALDEVLSARPAFGL